MYENVGEGQEDGVEEIVREMIGRLCKGWRNQKNLKGRQDGSRKRIGK